MYSAEKVMKEIKNILSLEVSYIQTKYAINEKGESIYPLTVDGKLYGNPSSIKDEEYKKLKELCVKNNIACMDFDSQETNVHHDFFGDVELLPVDFLIIENYDKVENGDFKTYNLWITDVIYKDKLSKHIMYYELRDEKYKELLKEKIKELMSLGYENETDLEIS